MRIPEWLLHILTQADNFTFDHGKLISFFSFLIYFVLSIIALILFQKFDPMNFATGVSAMAVGFGIHIKLNPGDKPDA